jgi:hypothetical protein
LHFFKKLRVKKSVTFFSLSPLSPKSFFQKKKEKKKANKGASAKPKGNGISPAGWRNHKQQQHAPLCRSLLADLKDLAQ